MRVYALTCGWLSASIGNFLEGEHGRIRVPVPCFLIDHPRGKVLFDTGLHLATQRDPHGRLGPIADFYTVDFAPGEEVSARLADLQIGVEEIRWVVQSHLHFDHCGGNGQLPDATIVVQRREWQAGGDPELRERVGYHAHDYDLGHDVVQIDGTHDLFGDGRVVCMPTYGHTPGHQSLLVRSERGDLVLAADAFYLRRTLEGLRLPPVVYDREQMLAALRLLGRLRDAGARVIFGHDPELWETIAEPPDRLA